jgi:hypothetical protein
MIKTDSTTLLPQSFLVIVQSQVSTNSPMEWWILWYFWAIWSFPFWKEVCTKWKSALQTKINQRSAESPRPHDFLKFLQRPQQHLGRVDKSFIFFPEKATGGLFGTLPNCFWDETAQHTLEGGEQQPLLLGLSSPLVPCMGCICHMSATDVKGDVS